MNNFKMDYTRFTQGDKYKTLPCILRIFKNYELRILWILRKYQQSKGVFQKMWKLMLSRYKRIYGIELICKDIGGGLRLIHPYGITVNTHAFLGQNVTLYKGVTIGVIDEGSKAGNPTLEDNITVCANATICGNVMIGSNTIIAANSFVNFDVPPNSIVMGNPGVIHHKENEEEEVDV